MALNIVENNRKWFEFIVHVRQWMSQNYQEVQSPTLVLAGGMEAELQTFRTQFHFGTYSQSLDLPTSPEFHLKKLLALGWPDIFEIKTCFRNEEFTPIHRPEFTMLEFYKRTQSFEFFMDEVENFVEKAALGFAMKSDNKPQPRLKKKRISVAQLFKQHLSFDLEPETSLENLKQLCLEFQIDTVQDDAWSDLFFRIWLEKIEPNFDPEVLNLVYDYPPKLAALSKISSQGWAQRFEIYWKGFELGNAFNELKDTKILRKRCQEENQKRKDRGQKPHPIDEDFIQACEKLPDCCGIALGLERLFMAIVGLKSISDFKVLDFVKPGLD